VSWCDGMLCMYLYSCTVILTVHQSEFVLYFCLFDYEVLTTSMHNAFKCYLCAGCSDDSDFEDQEYVFI
jgi:hypothetical protein